MEVPRARINDARDPQTFAIRFLFGAVLGMFLGFLVWFPEIVDLPALGVTLLFVAPAVICSLAAAYAGDRFWEEVLPWLRWM
jgi:hypothetical protein